MKAIKSSSLKFELTKEYICQLLCEINIKIKFLNWWANNKFSLNLSKPSKVIIKHSISFISKDLDKIYIPGIIESLFFDIPNEIFCEYNDNKKSTFSFDNVKSVESLFGSISFIIPIIPNYKKYNK